MQGLDLGGALWRACVAGQSASRSSPQVAASRSRIARVLSACVAEWHPSRRSEPTVPMRWSLGSSGMLSWEALLRLRIGSLPRTLRASAPIVHVQPYCLVSCWSTVSALAALPSSGSEDASDDADDDRRLEASRSRCAVSCWSIVGAWQASATSPSGATWLWCSRMRCFGSSDLGIGTTFLPCCRTIPRRVSLTTVTRRCSVLRRRPRSAVRPGLGRGRYPTG